MKKYIFGFIFIISLLIISPITAKASTIDQLQAQVNQLTQQISSLQATLAAVILSQRTAVPITPAPVSAPVITTQPAYNITSSQVTLNGTFKGVGVTTHYIYGTSSTVLKNETPLVSQGLNTSGNTGQTLSGLVANTTYYFQAIGKNSAGTTYGNILSFTTPPIVTPPPPPLLSIKADPTFTTPTYAPGSSSKIIASFVLTASSAGDVKINKLALDKDAVTDNLNIQNVKVMYGPLPYQIQFGTTRTTVPDGGVSMAFYPASPVLIKAGSNIILDVYADFILTTTLGTYASVIDLADVTGTSSQTGNSFSVGPADGQNVTISTKFPPAATEVRIISPTIGAKTVSPTTDLQQAANIVFQDICKFQKLAKLFPTENFAGCGSAYGPQTTKLLKKYFLLFSPGVNERQLACPPGTHGEFGPDFSPRCATNT